MILDSRNLFLDNASIVGNVGTNLIGNVIDSGSVHRDLGNGEHLHLFAEVLTSITAASAGSLVIQLISSASPSMTSPTVHISSPSLVTGTSAAGLAVAGSQLFFFELPLEGPTYLEYIGLQAVVGTANLSTGKLTAGLTLNKHGWQSYPRGYL